MSMSEKRSSIDLEAQLVFDRKLSAASEDQYPSTRSSSLTLVALPLDSPNGLKEKARADEPVLIAWDPLDPEHPFNWSKGKKMSVVFAGCFVTLLAGINATHIAIINPIASEYFRVTADQFTLSFTLYMIGVAWTPLFLAPLSELYGRNAIFQGSSLFVLLLSIPQATSSNFQGYLVARFFQGMASSVGASMVSGTVADMYRPKNRGTGMNIFTLLNFTGQAIGAVLFGWITPLVGVQWTYGILGFIAAFSCLLNVCMFKETRADILLARRARRLTAETGKQHVIKLDESKPNVLRLMQTSLFRPLKFLVTEPIVTAVSMWFGFAWGCVFMGGTSVTLTFEQYGWNRGQLGSAQVAVFIGGFLGFVSNYHQQYLYRRKAAKCGGQAPPEARLIWAAYGGLLFPLGLFAFAWTGRPSIPWIVPMIFLCLSYWGIACIFSAIFNYLADAYETYSSSAQAAQSVARNLIAAVLPLVARRMYKGMGYPQASSLVASIALVLSLAPFLLMKYGKILRQKSKVARSIEVESL
ncbi:MSF transporter [Papiliotrema laurentii]|uniref:MSF transporter n=1 Tax=Papiliotrema laurentii TaxID=5418 RepID=A0AAD9FRI4_PAPLA|nr:MSF transporter [Papiliotrema laurentii]